MKSRRSRRIAQSTGPHWRPIPAWFWMLIAAIAVAITAFVVTAWLLTIASHATPGTEQAVADLDAVRTGLAAGAGAGAAVGLLLAFRRQYHQEIATLLTDLDATERRITELYTKAVEQLGSDKAPVRLGGLYALERLAQDNLAQRPTIVKVICAYLRMPFPPEAPISTPAVANTENSVKLGAIANVAAIVSDDAWQQERQVRLAAQQILCDHLSESGTAHQSAHSASSNFWFGVRLDLADATVIDFSLSGRVVTYARFDRATFNGEARFDRTIFDGAARFHETTFNGNADFNNATFNGAPEFEKATFDGDAKFNSATFNGGTRFGETTFNGRALFYNAAVNGFPGFNGYAWFGKATFKREASFSEVVFNEGCGSSEVMHCEEL